ncbi:MAG TPA: N-6 DNA methylase [Herpetosiphonaceae bacterium]|nr:N-6 DNA methylase [Herpetosiphonaceae bacterium]
MDQNTQDELIRRAVERGYLSIRDSSRIIYYCKRQYEDNWRDPEERVRAAIFAWLILEREYPANRIDVEVTVPRRTPEDRADILIYEDDACRIPYLVVENKPRGVSAREATQAVEQAFGNANSLRAKYALYDNCDESRFYDVANFGGMERQANFLGIREVLERDYGRPRTLRLIAGAEPGVSDIGPVSSRNLEMAVRRAHALIWAGGARDPMKAFEEWCKLLFAKIHDERWTPNDEPRRFQVGAGENEVSVGNRIRQLYADAQRQDPTIWPYPLELPDSKIREVVAAIQHIALLAMDIDALGAAFERFFSTIFRGGLGQYFTQRELVRFVVALLQPREQDIVLDPTAGSGGFLLEKTLIQVWHGIDRRYAGRRNLDRLKNDFALNHLFGIELHDIAGRVCQTNLLLHQDGHTNVEVRRSCLDSSFTNPEIRLGRFSLVVGNPPFGDEVKEGDTDRLGTSRLADFELPTTDQIDSEIVILERSVKFLEPGGRLGMVVPDGLLNNAGEPSRCPALRRFLLRTCRLLAIVSLPDFAFRKAGAQNKTSLLFCQRFNDDEQRAFSDTYHQELDRLGDADMLTAVQREDQALLHTLGMHDYQVFLGEADQIGYSPIGIPLEANDLYHMRDHAPTPADETTLLGQYMRFRREPAAYTGADRPRCLAMRASELFAAHASRRMDPKYHLFKQREALATVPPGMHRYRLGDVLTRRVEVVVPADYPEEEFVTLTLTQEGGLEQREAGKGINPIDWHGAYFKEGARWYRAHADDLIISRIDVWKGCVAIIPEEFEGAIVTQEFPLFRVREELLRPYYLKLLLRTEYFQRAIRAITTGHSNRRRTQDTDFEDLDIFLPDPPVQDRIVGLVQERERALHTSRREFTRLLVEVEQCLMGQLSADALLQKEGLGLPG